MIREAKFRVFVLGALAWAGFACPSGALADIVEYHDADEGFSGIWTVDILGSGNYFIGSSTSNGDGDSNVDGDIDTLSGNAWGLSNGANGSVNTDLTLLSHSFDNGPLSVGQTFWISMDSGVTEGSSSSAAVGFSLYASGSDMFSFWLEPLDSSYYMYGPGYGPGSSSSAFEETGITFTDEGLAIGFTLVSSNTYTLQVILLESGQTYTFADETLVQYSGQPIDTVQIFSLGN